MYYCHIAAHTHYFCNHHKDLCCILILSLSFSLYVFFSKIGFINIPQFIVSFQVNMYSVEVKNTEVKMAGKFLWLILNYVNFTDICSFANVCSSKKKTLTSWPFTACAIISGFSEIQCKY